MSPTLGFIQPPQPALTPEKFRRTPQAGKVVVEKRCCFRTTISIAVCIMRFTISDMQMKAILSSLPTSLPQSLPLPVLG